MPPTKYAQLVNVSQSSHVLACTFLFVFPLWVAASLSSRKFSLDTFIQSRLIMAIIFSGLQYSFLSLSWLSSLPWENRQKSMGLNETKNTTVLKWVRRVATLMQSLLILLQVLILVYYFLRQWPSGYTGMDVVCVGAFAAICLNIVQLVVVYHFIRIGGAAYRGRLGRANPKTARTLNHSFT